MEEKPVGKLVVKTKVLLESKYIFAEKDMKIYDKVGEGRFAKVYAAEHKHVKNKIVIRYLKCAEAAAINKKKLQLEAKSLLKLAHPNIVKCYGIIIEKNAFILEYCGLNVNVDGVDCVIHTLLGFLTTVGDQISLATQIDAISDISNGVNYLHQLNLTAGDLKPANVLISGEIDNLIFKLSDITFSTSVFLSTVSMMSSCLASDEATYTLLYLAPELLNKNFSVSNTMNSASDIYALAVTVYQILFPDEEINALSTPLMQMEALKNGWRPQIPSSAFLKKEPIPSMLKHIKESWSENPNDRPSAEYILKAAKLWKNFSEHVSYLHF